MYSIGQVASMFRLPVSTLRYYDKEGLFPSLKRIGGIRQFDMTEVESLRLIECLKKSGMEIKEIKQFMKWCTQGASTYKLRKDFFEKQREKMERELLHMNQVMDMIRFKCWYYELALDDGNENRLAKIDPFHLPDYMPEQIKEAYLNSRKLYDEQEETCTQP